MKKLALILMAAFSGISLCSEFLSPEEYVQQTSRIDKTVAIVEQWMQQLNQENRSLEAVEKEIKQYIQSHPEFAEVYEDYFDTRKFHFNIVDILLIQAAMYISHNQIEDNQRLAMVAVLEQAGLKRTLDTEQVQSLASLAMGKYAEVPALL